MNLSSLKTFFTGTILKIPLRLKWFFFTQRKRQNVYITRQGRNDGFGAQIHGQLSTMAFANAMGITYVHSPLKKIAFLPEGFSDEEWLSYWDDLLRLGDDQKRVADLKGIESRRLKNLSHINNDSDVCFAVGHCHRFTDMFPDSYLEVIPPIQKRFFDRYGSNESQIVVVSIHIRRGDVNQTNWPGRYTSDDKILNAVALLDERLKEGNRPVSYRIFSQGNELDFRRLKDSSFNFDFRLDEDPKQTFIELAKSDVLILSKSSFSYVAGLLCKGTVIYEPFRHPAMKHWIPFKDISSAEFSGL